MEDFLFVLALIGGVLIFFGLASYWHRKHLMLVRFEEFLKIVEGRCMYCGNYNSEGVKDTGYWIELKCDSCGKTSRVHLRT